MQLWDASGIEVSSKICKILGGEGGNADVAKPWPADGLLTDAAYRWDVVSHCTLMSPALTSAASQLPAGPSGLCVGRDGQPMAAVLTHDARVQVCNFTAYKNTSMYLINKPNSAFTTSLTPFYCHSHLIMKIDVGDTDPNAGAPTLGATNDERDTGPLPTDVLQVDGSLPPNTAIGAGRMLSCMCCHVAHTIIVAKQRSTPARASAC
jgi:hypothetical protein